MTKLSFRYIYTGREHIYMYFLFLWTTNHTKYGHVIGFTIDSEFVCMCVCRSAFRFYVMLLVGVLCVHNSIHSFIPFHVCTVESTENVQWPHNQNKNKRTEGATKTKKKKKKPNQFTEWKKDSNKIILFVLCARLRIQLKSGRANYMHKHVQLNWFKIHTNGYFVMGFR